MRLQTTILTCFILFYSLAYSQEVSINQDYMNGVYAFEKANYKQAAEYITLALNTENSKPDWLMKRGEANYQAGNYQQAIIDFLTADSIMPDIACYSLARCYAQLGDKPKAFKYLEKNLQSKFRLPKNQIKLDKAFASIEPSIEWKRLWDTDWHSRFEMQLSDAAYALKCKNLSEAFDILDKTLDQNDKRHEAYFLRAQTHLAQNDNRSALGDLNNAIEIKPNQIEYIKLRALVHTNLKHYNKALDDYNTVLSISPYELSLYFQRAVIEEKLSLYEQATNDIKTYLAYYTDNIEAHYEYGIINYQTGEYLSALRSFNTVLLHDKTQAKYFVARANTYLATNTYQSAINDYTMALDINARDKEAYYNRGVAKFALGDKNGSCSDWKQAYRLGFLPADLMLRKYCSE